MAWEHILGELVQSGWLPMQIEAYFLEASQGVLE
jgi:hypothetical protein